MRIHQGLVWAFEGQHKKAPLSGVLSGAFCILLEAVLFSVAQ